MPFFYCLLDVGLGLGGDGEAVLAGGVRTGVGAGVSFAALFAEGANGGPVFEPEIAV